MYKLKGVYIYAISANYCGIPKAPINGVVNFNGTVTGSIARYQCNDGCVIGQHQRTCGHDGYWSGITPLCHCKLTNIPWI